MKWDSDLLCILGCRKSTDQTQRERQNNMKVKDTDYEVHYDRQRSTQGYRNIYSNHGGN